MFLAIKCTGFVSHQATKKKNNTQNLMRIYDEINLNLIVIDINTDVATVSVSSLVLNNVSYEGGKQRRIYYVGIFVGRELLISIMTSFIVIFLLV